MAEKEPFVQKQGVQGNSAFTALLKQRAAPWFAQHFSRDALLGRGQVFPAKLESETGPVKAGSRHPLLAFVATPRLPPELAQYIEREHQ